MTAPAWVEARLALVGVLRLARGDPGGLACFDPSLDGFWHSFRAALPCYPLYLILLGFPVDAFAGAGLRHWDGVVVETIHFVIAWVAFPLLVLPLADWLDRGDQFLRFMVAYNWCQILPTAVFAAVALAGAGGLVPADAAQLADTGGAILALVYEWYIARVALAVGGLQAVAVVVLDIVLATVLNRVSISLYG